MGFLNYLSDRFNRFRILYRWRPKRDKAGFIIYNFFTLVVFFEPDPNLRYLLMDFIG
ncbi:hypothetical protein LEP1GSC040_3111 [Leptospira santarosai str. 2000030832]|nr:hypothetical protein LEP1GSC040_3111 [Leptospira santarosai str. 2000030832]